MIRLSKFKKLTFVLMTTTALMGSISSVANYDVVDQDPINKTDPLHKIASKSVKLYPKGMPDERKPANAKVVSYEPAIDIAIKEQQIIKKAVLDDPYFELNHTREEHIGAFYDKVYVEYATQKSEIVLTTTNHPLKAISAQIFEASEHDLSLSHQRGQYLPEDKTTNKHFTLMMNKKGQLSLFVHDLGVVLPLYKQHRVAPRENDVDAYVPYGKIFTNNQYQTLFFLNRLLSEKPANRFKSGLLYRIQNPNEPWEQLWGKLFPKPMQPKAIILPAPAQNNHLTAENVLYGMYFKEDYMPKMAQSFRSYNKSSLNGTEIVRVLFPDVKADEVPDLNIAVRRFQKLKESGRPYAQFFTPQKIFKTPENAYESHFKTKYMPIMEQSFNSYNRTRYGSWDIVKLLFTNVQDGEAPQIKQAVEKFNALSKSGRPYATLFKPQEIINKEDTAYEAYFKNTFMPKMEKSFDEYNKTNKTSYEIVKILFPELKENEIPDIHQATSKFNELAKGNRPYAVLFQPPEKR